MIILLTAIEQSGDSSDSANGEICMDADGRHSSFKTLASKRVRMLSELLDRYYFSSVTSLVNDHEVLGKKLEGLFEHPGHDYRNNGSKVE